MKQDLILIGGGGHCRSCIDVIEESEGFRIVGIVDVSEKLHKKIYGYQVIAVDEDLQRLVGEYGWFLITLGQIKTPKPRMELFQSVKNLGGQFPVIVSPRAYVSRHASIGEGTIVMHQALVNAGAIVGKNCIVNSKALIEHDAVIEDHCHISTAAVINGGVKVGSGTFIGSNATTKQGIEIGKEVVVGAGSTVMYSLPDTAQIAAPTPGDNRQTLSC